MKSVHPGEVMKGEPEELGTTLTKSSRQFVVPSDRESQIIAGKRSVSGETALRFGHWFGAETRYWPILQSANDLVQTGSEIGEAILCRPTRADFPGSCAMSGIA